MSSSNIACIIKWDAKEIMNGEFGETGRLLLWPVSRYCESEVEYETVCPLPRFKPGSCITIFSRYCGAKRV